MIFRCADSSFAEIQEIINDAAEMYRGVIPEDRYHDPYMPEEHLRREIESGVEFWAEGYTGRLAGVMGFQDVGDVVLIRHAYIRPQNQRQGIGGRLLERLRSLTDKPILIGTWAAATWAIDFYRKNGFAVVRTDEKDRLLKQYWDIPERQVETSVVLKETGRVPDRMSDQEL